MRFSNCAQRVGYPVSFVPFKDGKPAGPVRDFVTGWMIGPDQKEVWGRPVGLRKLGGCGRFCVLPCSGL